MGENERKFTNWILFKRNKQQKGAKKHGIGTPRGAKKAVLSTQDKNTSKPRCYEACA